MRINEILERFQKHGFSLTKTSTGNIVARKAGSIFIANNYNNLFKKVFR